MRNDEFESREAAREWDSARRMTDLALVAVGGCFGALARYGVEIVVAKRYDASFPVSTLAINVAGAFALGILVALVVERHTVSELMMPALGIGFLGAFTTFSTFALESVALAEGGYLVLAMVYVLATNVAGIVAAVAGLLVGRQL